jgi:gamma-glutamyltranspeptidase
VGCGTCEQIYNVARPSGLRVCKLVRERGQWQATRTSSLPQRHPTMTHAFDWSTGYASQRSPMFARNIVSTSHPLAAQAGLRMLQRGGNAVDAAIATAAVMTIVEPCSNGLGSDAFCILWDGQQLQGLNASGCAPAAWTPDYFQRKYGADAKTPPQRGWDAVTVPGAVGAWMALSERSASCRSPTCWRPRSRLPSAATPCR